jgi:hypothetical protein
MQVRGNGSALTICVPATGTVFTSTSRVSLLVVHRGELLILEHAHVVMSTYNSLKLMLEFQYQVNEFDCTPLSGHCKHMHGK